MYSFILDGMTWSYSRIKAYEDCPYRFFLKYIYECEEKKLFFSDFGSFMHEVLEGFYLNKLSKDGVIPYYLCNFKERVVGEAPSSSVFLGFFDSGLDYLKTIEKPDGEVLAVEERVVFRLNGYRFIGYVDLIVKADDQTIEIWDHKSHPLKPRSNRATPTKTDKELDEYLRQLYLYSIPICKKYGINPARLVFNCYRKGILIKEQFRQERLEEAKRWATSSIEQIKHAKTFPPSIEYFKCRYLCGVSDHCEYYGASS